MGLAMTFNLIKADFQVSGYDLDPNTLKQLKAAGGTPQNNAAFLAENADVILCSLPGPQALHDAVKQISISGNA